MATLDKSGAGGLGGGDQGSKIRWTQLRSLPTALGFIEIKELRQGEPTRSWSYMGVMNAANTSEGAAAVTPGTFPAPTQVTGSPAPFIVSLEATGQAFKRVLAENDLEELFEAQMMFAADKHMMIDGTVGWQQLVTTVTNIAGTSGLAIDLDVTEESHETVVDTVGHKAHTVTILNGHLKKQLRIDRRTSGASYLANSGVADHVKDLILNDPFLRDSYVTSLSDGHQHVFVEPFNDYLKTVSGDYVGCTFIPAFGAMSRVNGAQPDPQQMDLIPAFGAVVEPEPALAVTKTSAKQELKDGILTPYRMAWREYQGRNIGTVDLHGEAGLVLVRAPNACRLIGTAS